MIPPRLLLDAYASGVFPMAEPGGELLWFSPDPRGILPLEDLHIPHGLSRSLRKRTYEIRINTCFETVMRCCAQRKETWIDQNIFESYAALHQLGYAHSVEAWDGEGLAGALYGVALGGAFFGESMFHHRTDASKYALVALVDRLNARGYQLLDIQWTTSHLNTFGAVEISRQQYMEQLKKALTLQCDFTSSPTAHEVKFQSCHRDRPRVTQDKQETPHGD